MNSHDQITNHLDAVAAVTAAGIPAPEQWTVYAKRWLDLLEEPDHITAYAEAVTEAADDVDLKRALALGAAATDTIARASIRIACAERLHMALVTAWRPHAADVYDELRARYNALGQTFAKHAAITDPETDPAQLVGASAQQRKAWLDAAVTSEEIMSAVPALRASAQLAGKPCGTAETIAGLTVSLGTARRRAVWEILDGPDGRCHRHGLLVNAGAVIAAPALDDIDAISGLARPAPMQVRQVRSGIGWRNEEFDPELEPSR